MGRGPTTVRTSCHGPLPRIPVDERDGDENAVVYFDVWELQIMAGHCQLRDRSLVESLSRLPAGWRRERVKHSKAVQNLAFRELGDVAASLPD